MADERRLASNLASALIETPALSIAAVEGWELWGVGDFDGNGYADLFWYGSQAKAFSNWLGSPSGFTINDDDALTPLPALSFVVGIGDFNGDGRDDLTFSNDTAQVIYARLGQTNGGYVASDGTALDTKWAGAVPVVGIGDFDGDARDDLLSGYYEGGPYRLSLGTTAGGFELQEAFTPFVGSSWRIMGTGDFNADGRDDILWRNIETGTISNWLANADGTFTINDANAMTAAPMDWSVLEVADYNGDGRADILWGKRHDDTVTVSNWLATPSGGYFINDAAALTQVSSDYAFASAGPVIGIWW